MVEPKETSKIEKTCGITSLMILYKCVVLVFEWSKKCKIYKYTAILLWLAEKLLKDWEEILGTDVNTQPFCATLFFDETTFVHS